MAGINIFTLMGSVMVDTKKAEDSIQKTESKAGKLAGALGNGIKTAAKWGAGIAAGASVAAGALLAVDNATKEYRENMAKLNTAYESVGMSTDNAKTAYEGFYRILGDSDTATEASQLLASLAQSEEDLVKWTDISAGVMGMFGDALPIEGLIESANETAKVGQVTGALADALNWAGISEDEFNEKLAACSTEQERNTLITETLSSTYEVATETFKKNNDQVMQARDAQMKLDEAMGKLGSAVGTVKQQLMSDFIPAISDVVGAFADFMSGAEGADVALQEAIKNMVDTIIAKLPDFLEFGINIIIAIARGLITNLPYLLEQLPGLVIEIVKALFELGVELYDVGIELFEQLWEGLKFVWSYISGWVSEKVSWLTDKLAFWRSGSDEMDEEPTYRKGRTVDVDGRHATGLSYVPHDNYIAALHKGEEVVSATDKQGILDILKAMASGSNNGQPVNINLVLDGHTLAKVLYNPLQNETKLQGTSIVQGVA